MSVLENRRSTVRLALLVSAVVSVAVATLFAVVPAHAHDQVVSASPGANESLATAPTEVVIEFTSELLDTGALINVTDASGQDVTDGDVVLDGRVVTRKLQSNLPNGQYEIVWRVVSADGHPITDQYQFSIGEPVAPPNDDAASATDASADAADSAESNGAEITAVAATEGQNTIDWGRIASVAILGAFAGVAVYAGIFALIRRKNTQKNS